MKRHSKQIIAQIKEMRSRGFSIPQLVEHFGIAKTTIWHHVKEIELPADVQASIRARQGDSKGRSVKSWQKAEIHAKTILADSCLREMAVSVSMLYWAEGNKRELIFTNTDPDMLRMYIKALMLLFTIPIIKIKLLIRISDPIDQDIASSYWRMQLGLVEGNIKINHNNVQNKTKTKHGICRISVTKSSYYHKVIQCMIAELKSSRSSRDRTSHS